MKGIEHFRKAEQLLGLVEEREDGFSDTYLKAALVHATLAAATSMSNLVTVWGDIAGMMRADSELADAEPPRAEPLVTCDQRGESGMLRCGLPVGHDGQHADKNDLGTIRWSQDSAETFQAEPVAICNAGPADDGPERCHLAMGHDGLHEHVYGSRAVHWSTADELRTIAPESIYQSTATDLHMEMPR